MQKFNLKPIVITIITCIIGTVCFSTSSLSADNDTADNASDVAEINIYTDVKGAKLLLDQEYIGNSPLELIHIPTGEYTLTIKYKSYLPVDYDIKITAPRSDFYFQVDPVLMRSENDFGFLDGVLVAALVVAAAVGGYFWVYE